MTPESNAWLKSVATHSGSLNQASVHIYVPEDLYDEFSAFISEPTEIADQADVWLRRPKS